VKPRQIVSAATRPVAGRRLGGADSSLSPVGAAAFIARSASAVSDTGHEAYLTGTDAWNWDAPFVRTARTGGETHDASLNREGQRAGCDIGHGRLEELHNLELPPVSGERKQIAGAGFRPKGLTTKDRPSHSGGA
jgi:hypothetical protein